MKHLAPNHPKTRNGKALIVDDDIFVVEMIRSELQRHGIETVAAFNGIEAINSLNEEISVVILDLLMPRMGGRECLGHLQKVFPEIPVIVLSSKDTATDATNLLKCGAFHYLTKPVSTSELFAVIQEAEHFRNLKDKQGKKGPRIRQSNAKQSFAAMDATLEERINKIAVSEASVLLNGESGTGKTTVARRIHDLSPRSDGPFISINCASLPKDLFESELFGYEKGAFTGADQNREGKVAAADQGTLFLDEIGDLPLEMQPKLLTFLQDKSFHQIGSNKLHHSDTRIIAATHQNLEDCCRQNQFRYDLYFRINVLGLEVKPLREKSIEEFQVVLDGCLDYLKEKYLDPSVIVSSKAVRKLFDHDWPGNIRELENCLERAFVFRNSERIDAEDIGFKTRPVHDDSVHLEEALERYFEKHSLRDLEELSLDVALRSKNQNRSEAAKMLGVSERTVFNKLKAKRN
ncbi:MAG: sigma-54 dependent transcriptional regulator [Planctomycetota bacterium]|nr:sigma-54 dependent transcriptional regulator [Planctomycetota bacterium]